MGINTRGRSLLYISPGTGYWGIPFRIGAIGEITLVTLQRSTSGTSHARVAGRRRVSWLVGSSSTDRGRGSSGPPRPR
jgi:hypothetical protein